MKKSIPVMPDYDKMCFLSDSDEEHRMDMLKILVKDSRYVCNACGRAASNEEVICSPENLKDGSSSGVSDPESMHVGGPVIPDYEKMCFLSDSNEEHRMDMLKSLIKDSRYVCSACGRAASSEAAICSPEKL